MEALSSSVISPPTRCARSRVCSHAASNRSASRPRWRASKTRCRRSASARSFHTSLRCRMFLDRARLSVRGGDGGKGVISFRREAHVPRGGPDGGDGGNGGDLVLRADRQLASLGDFAFKRDFAATDGAPGEGKNKSGKAGRDVIVRVPAGTIIRDVATGEEVADLVTDGAEIVAARGGSGGRGNGGVVTGTRGAPRHARGGAREGG